MLTIHKYPLDFQEAYTRLKLPKGAKPLHYAMQGGALMVWCEVDDMAPCRVDRCTVLEVHFIGTGVLLGFLDENFSYATTVMPVEGLVLHLYTRLS